MRNKDFFNSKAESWDNDVIHDMKKVSDIIDLIHIHKGDKVLDVGTGTGVLIPVLKSHVGENGQITAIDAAEKMIEVAQSKFKDDKINFIVGDVLKTDFKDDKFDLIICYSMFPHFEAKDLAISTLARLLKPRGKLAICHSQSRDDINNLHKDIEGSVQNDRLPSMDVMNQMFRKAGIHTRYEIDNTEMFVIVGVRPDIIYV